MPFAQRRSLARDDGRRWLRRALATAVTILLAGSMVIVGNVVPPAEAVAGQVTGRVFRDYNANGVYNATAVTGTTTVMAQVAEVGIAGVTVTAYNGAGTAVATTTTGTSGTYTLSGLGNNTALRIEFTGYPAGFLDSQHGGTTSTTTTTNTSNTSVQFVSTGTNGASEVNLALHKATDLAKSTNTPIITSIQAVGTYNGDSSGARALTYVRRSDAVHTAATTAASVLATFGQVGAVWGVTTQPIPRTTSSNNEQYYVYASALVKRHSGLGPAGLAGLYRLTVTENRITGARVGTGTGGVERMSLTGTGMPSYGTFVRTASDLNGNNGDSTQLLDSGAFDAVGKQGIGGIAYDDNYLYVVNLYDGNVYRYAISSLNFSSTSTPIPSAAPTQIATGLASGEHPWAISIHEGRIYLGVSNENGATARVISISTSLTGGWTQNLSIPLNYNRGIAWSTAAPTSGQTQALWHAWNSNPATLYTNSNLNSGWDTWRLSAWGQAIFSGITFDDGGNMVIGLLDRFSLQSGEKDPWPNETQLVVGVPVGDTLYAGRASNGTFTIENGATQTGGTAPILLQVTTPNNDTANRQPSFGTGTVGAEQTSRQNTQHGGREFFEDSVGWNGAGGISGQGVVHDETTLGAVAVLPGLNETVSTSFDPAEDYNGAGLRFLDLTDGHSVDGFNQYEQANSYFGKAGGIGGIAALLTDAPVEIGNRVWYDADADGIQDADEPAINGAVVQLWTADGSGNPISQVGSSKTTATINGQPGTYYFRTQDADTDPTSGFTKDGNYVVKFVKGTGSPTYVWPGSTPSIFSTMPTWAQLELTTQTAGSNTLIDSNPNISNGNAPITVGSFGEDDHSIDAGYVALRTFSITKSIAAGTPPSGAQFTINVTAATNFRGENMLSPTNSPTDASRTIVETTSYTLTAGQTLVTTERIPYGYTLEFTEQGVPSAAVAFSPNTGGGSDDTGRLVILGTGGVVTASNSFTSVTVNKALEQSVTLPPGTTFPLEYTIDGGTVQTTELTVGTPFTLSVPYGTQLAFREPLVGPFSWGGYIWGSGTWTSGATPLTPDVNGWVTVTANSSTTALVLALLNHPYLPPALPFSGGTASDIFTYGGGTLLVITFGLLTWRFFSGRRRRVASHRA